MRYLLLLLIVACMLPALPAQALDREHRELASQAIEQGILYLRSTQLEDGSWSPDYGPAITALCITAMLDQPRIDASDPTVRKALDYILSCVNEDGSIHTGLLANYNTSICVSALSRVHNDPQIAEVIDGALTFLREIQWHGQADPQGNQIDENHPWFGGAGYGRHGRPDLSNTQFMLQAFHDAGIHCEDPAIQRAMAFVSRCQATADNDLYDEETLPRDGGFIYATSVNGDHVGVPQSMASPDQIDEGRAGNTVSGLRTYGSMTYAGFKSYVYADLDSDDPRVLAVLGWVENNYVLTHNPGMPEAVQGQGHYYYLLTFARAMDAWGQTHLTTSDGKTHDWANDLIAQLANTQHEEGYWINDADRWREGDANLVTAYALNALVHARN